MIDKFITSRFLLEDHPIKKLSRKFQKVYLEGVGEVLHSLCASNANARFCYDCLCRNLAGEELGYAWNSHGEFPHARRAQKLRRDGFHFFRMSQAFWWDVFRIASISKFHLNDDTLKFLLNKSSNWASKKYLRASWNYFENGEPSGLLPSQLCAIYEQDKLFSSIPKKRFVVVGTMSAGKSTLINALVGRKITMTKTVVCTSNIAYLYNKPFVDGFVYSDGSSHLYSDTVESNKSDIPHIALHFNGVLGKEPIILVDTPGVDYAYDETHRKKTRVVLEKGSYDVIICVINAPYIESEGENALIAQVSKIKNKKKIFVLNQLDRFEAEDDSIEENIRKIKSMLKDMKEDAEIVPFSAKTVFLLKKGCSESLSDLEKRELENLKMKFSSSVLYDLNFWGTGRRSKENDFYSLAGITNLETIIVNQINEKN